MDKVKKVFEFEGIEFRIVDVTEIYRDPQTNRDVPITNRLVLAPNNNRAPIEIKHYESLKSIQKKDNRTTQSS